MNRILRPERKYFIILIVIFAILISLPIALGLIRGGLLECMKVSLFLLLLSAIPCFSHHGMKIVIEPTHIIFKRPLSKELRANYNEIYYSVYNYFLNPGHPISLSIFGKDEEEPIIEIHLSTFKKEDVLWLISLPQLKIQQDKDEDEDEDEDDNFIKKTF